MAVQPYSIEISSSTTEFNSDTKLVMFFSDKPFLSINVGDLIDPSFWGKCDCRPDKSQTGQNYRVTQIIHAISADSHRLLVSVETV